MVEPIRVLCQRFRSSERPVAFINDNFARWQDSFDDLLARVEGSGRKGAAMAVAFHPHAVDFRLLKPRHSGFFETPLPSLLAHLRVGHVVVCGLATDSCVLSTALDARIRDFAVTVPADTTASQTHERTVRTLAHLRESCGVETPASAAVRP